MTYHIAPFGKAMTAIAAAVAFTSAHPPQQHASAAPLPTAETPADAPAATEPVAPEPVATEAPAATEAAPPPAPRPKVETIRAKAASAAAPKPAKASARAAPKPVRRASAPAAAPEPSPAVAAAVAPAGEAAASPPPPVVAPPAIADPAPAPAAEPAPASGMAGALMADLLAEERLPYAGGAALGLLALGGAGLLSRRRKRRRENAAFEARQQFLDTAEGQAEPVLELGPSDEVRAGPVLNRAAAPIHDPVPAKGAANQPAATKLPNGFDLSRFGRHVQAAYRGPTADNPSLSLKHRLRRATALDQQERNAGEQAGRGEAPASIPARGNWGSRPDAGFLFRRAGESAKSDVEQG